MGNILRQAVQAVAKGCNNISASMCHGPYWDTRTRGGIVCHTQKQVFGFGDPSRGWGQLREGNIRFDSSQGLSQGRQAYNDRNVAEALLAARENGTYYRDHLQRDRGDRHMISTDSQERKNLPIVTGVLDYFPDALLAIAEVSRKGNDQHNPGEPLHWSREKSADHADCVGRHLLERGTLDKDGSRHSAKAAWRVLALLQLEIEHERDKQG